MTAPSLETLLWPSKQLSTADSESALNELCKQILGDGLPISMDRNDGTKSSPRAMAWKLLLGVREMPAQEYLDLVQLGASAVNDKIRNDTFRTLATDIGFQERVKEEMLVRLLDVFVWHTVSDPKNLDFGYVQGMNVLAAPFLYAMDSELEAFYCFTRFIEVNCPLYVQKTLEGVHRGLKLLDMCMAILDPELHSHLKSKGIAAETYAFPSILTFSACTPPLDEVLQLWDFFLAFGVHLNVLCVVAQLYLCRQAILDDPSPTNMLRTFPPLNARSIIALCCQFVKTLPEELNGKLVRHASRPLLSLHP